MQNYKKNESNLSGIKSETFYYIRNSLSLFLQLTTDFFNALTKQTKNGNSYYSVANLVSVKYLIVF